ncbi:ferric reductase like transmembrane component-domain-containing protein [Umbelopsis sp. PMI_123]|nr:ferric reductase like transmembrane component-domain-containing protein [Umbelopsis sp. PMI_123]
MADDLISQFRPTSNFHQAGYTYALVIWGLFLLYCIIYQFKRLRTYFARYKAIKTGRPQPYHPGAFTRAIHRLEYTVRLPVIGDYMAVKHLCILSFILIWNTICILFAPFTLSSDGYMFPAVSQMDRRAAYVAVVNFSLVIIFGSRNTIITKMSGISFEQLIPYHRWLAKLGFAEMITHFVWRIMVQAQKYGTAKAALFLDIEQGTGTIAALGYLILYVTSLGYIRRNYFEVFYYSHIFGIVLAVAASMWHEVGIMLYFIPSLFLWLGDRAIRSYKSWHQTTTLLEIDGSADTITRVVFEKDHAKSSYRPGQYVFVAFSGGVNGYGRFKRLLTWANWHPMTISEIHHDSRHHRKQDILESQANNIDDSAEEEKNMSIFSSSSSTAVQYEDLGYQQIPTPQRDHSLVGSLHIKTLGNYTTRLRDIANKSSDSIKIRVDGPFGSPLDFADQPVFVAISTGVGVTPSLAFIKDLVERRSQGLGTVETNTIYFVWSVANEGKLYKHTKAFLQLLAECAQMAENSIQSLSFIVEIYITREEKPGNLELLQRLSTLYKWQLEYRRINTKDAIQRISNSHRHVCMHTCGSLEFMTTVKNTAVKQGWSVHDEAFEF